MDRVEKSLSARSRLRKATNNEVRVNTPGDWPGWFFKYPGLKNGDFNRAGLPAVDKVTRMGEIYLAVHQKIAGRTPEQDFFQDRSVVVKGRVLTFTPQFYSRAAVNFPIIMRGGMSRVGRTSIDFFQEYFANQDADCAEFSITRSTTAKEPIFSNVVRGVFVSSKTRKPVSFTDDTVRELSSRLVPGAETFPTINQPDSIPENSFKWRVQVRHDDIDSEFHANQASFLLYATECAAQAAHERYYSRIAEDVAFYPVKRACGIHMDEALVGDELEVSTWEDADDKMRLHFVICKQAKTIYYAQLDFFDSVFVTSLI